MLSLVEKIAVYTTIYPGVEAYLPDWYRSVRAQTDQSFQLWIGLDGVESEAVEAVIGAHVPAIWVISEHGSTPARIRQRSLVQIVETCDAVVLVDSDDVLQDSRVAAARAALETSELAACGLQLVNEQNQELGLIFDLPFDADADALLLKSNVFGFSNSAYRCDLLRRCLPVPDEVTLVDWFLATRAWLLGARLALDPVVRMNYRQHRANTARVTFPVSTRQVVRDTELVRSHFRFVLAVGDDDFLPERRARLQMAASRVEIFHERIIQEPGRLQGYVETLNTLHSAPRWWSSVANPSLESMWQTTPQFKHEQR